MHVAKKNYTVAIAYGIQSLAIVLLLTGAYIETGSASFLLIAFLGLAIYLERRALLSRNRWFLYLSIVSIPLVYICTQAGWIVAEVGRQPWTIQDLLTTGASVSGVSTSSVATTTIMFFVLFSVLLAAELAILFKVIKKGPSA